MITEAGEERLIPRSMFDPDAFQHSPVELPLISIDALRHLLRVFFVLASVWKRPGGKKQ